MRRTLIPAGGLFALLPGAASAHAAFGNLGPFYAGLLHPLADPAQGLILAGVGVLLARQPLATVRPAYVALVLAGGLTVLLGTAVGVRPGLAPTALAATGLGLAALSGVALGRWPVVALAAAAVVWAGLAIDLPSGFRAGALSALGGSLGIALAGLLVWGLVDELQRRLGRIAGAVAGSWVAAVGVMTAAFALTGSG
jgi:hypothetical protein